MYRKKTNTSYTTAVAPKQCYRKKVVGMEAVFFGGTLHGWGGRVSHSGSLSGAGATVRLHRHLRTSDPQPGDFSGTLASKH